MATSESNTPATGVAGTEMAAPGTGSAVPLPESQAPSKSEGAKPANVTKTPTAMKQTNPKGPPPGYKLVKVRKDGAIITVMRKMSPEELEASGQKEPPPTAAKEGVDYKIVTVRNTDGSIIRVKRAIKPAEIPAASATEVEKQKSDDKSASADNPVTNVKVKQDKPNITTNMTSSSPPTRTEQGAETAEEFTDVTAALAEQKEYFRERRMQKYRGSLIRSLGTVLGSAIGHDISGGNYGSLHGHGDIDEIHDGDVIDSDEDWSDDDETNVNDEIEHDNHYGDRYSGSSETTLHPDASRSAQNLITGIAGRVAGAPCVSQKPAITAAPASTAKSPNSDKEKITYNVTTADLEASEKKSADKDLERPLRRHWTEFMFYFMASLSVILPLLFIILSIFIYEMNNKPVDSSWKKVPEIIKVGVSAWPIVFAAVVAQVFKGYATWRVERGIKLMQLEQLVGSSSFGSAIKQPLTFRQLNVLSLILLVVWCLSPLGSQALQRSYTTSGNELQDNVTIYHLDKTQFNQVFSVNASGNGTANSRASDRQFVAMQFLSSLLPVNQGNTSDDSYDYMDRYNHPILYRPGDDQFPISAVGHPVVLPDSIIPSGLTTTNKNAPYEYIDFWAHSSYFEFNCSEFSIRSRSELLTVTPPYHWSDSETLGLSFTNTGNGSSISHVSFASANFNEKSEEGDEWEYSHIECDFWQKYIRSLIVCDRHAPSGDQTSISSDCYQDTYNISWLSADFTEEYGFGTELADFAEDWTSLGALVNANTTGTASTPTELYLASDNFQMDFSAYMVGNINLSDYWNSTTFARSFATLFNTWVDLGYCPECQALATVSDLHSADTQMTNNLGVANNSVTGHYYSIVTPRSYSLEQVYVINQAWAACFLVCTVLLLLSGIASIIIESITIAPDTLGYVSTVARNSRYLQVKPTSGAMSGPQRARELADTEVMMQDVKSNADVGKIALGLKTEKAVKLRCDRLYR